LWSPWSLYSRETSPIIEKFSRLPEAVGIDFYKVEIADQPEICMQVGVGAVSFLFKHSSRLFVFLTTSLSKIPTVVLFKDGRKVDEVVGAEADKLEVKN
jgi:thioredoxin-like negative regulator of GroEL